MVKSRNRKEVICCLLWKTNKPTGPSRWRLCAMLVGGIVLHRHRRQAGALLWMKRSLTIALGLLHGKQIQHLSAFLGAEHFYPGLILPSDIKSTTEIVFGKLECSRLDALQKAA